LSKVFFYVNFNDRSITKLFGRVDPSRLSSIPSVLSLNSAPMAVLITSLIAGLTSVLSMDSGQTRKAAEENGILHLDLTVYVIGGWLDLVMIV
jgi:hypothetical protein